MTSDPVTALAEYRSSLPQSASSTLDIDASGPETTYTISMSGVHEDALRDLEHELAIRDWTEADGELYHPTFIPECGILAPPEIYDHFYATGLLLHPELREAKRKAARSLILGGFATMGIFSFHALINFSWALAALGVPVGGFVVMLGLAKLFAIRQRQLPFGGKPTPAFLKTTLQADGELMLRVRLTNREVDRGHAGLVQGEVERFFGS